MTTTDTDTDTDSNPTRSDLFWDLVYLAMDGQDPEQDKEMQDKLQKLAEIVVPDESEEE